MEKVSEIKMFKEAAGAKRILNFLFIMVIGYAMAYLSGITGAIGSMIFKFLPDYITETFFINIAGFAVLAGLVMLYVKFVEKRPFRSLGFSKEEPLIKYLTGVLIGIIMITVTVVLGQLTGAFKITFNTQVSVSIGSILIMGVGFIIQGGAEEVLVRGWMLPIFSARYSVKWGIVLSAVFFTLLHGANPGMTFMPILNLFLFSIFAALMVIKQKHLWGVCGMHMSWNWFQGNFFGIKVSGLETVGGSVLITENVPGKDLLSGGAFGAEASLIITIIYVILIVLLATSIKKEQSFE